MILDSLPAQLLEMMMQRRHLEDTLLVAQFVAAHLQHHRDRFEDEDAADERQQQFLADDDGDRADGAAQSQRADVAHEDLRRMGVVPEKSDGCAHHGAAEDGQLADHGHALQFKVVGKDHVAADIGEHGQRAGGDDGAADGQTVEAVGQVHRVRRADQHKDDPNDKGQKRQEAQVRNRSGPACHSRSGRQLLMNGTVNCVENILNCCSTTSAMATAAAGQRLPQQLGARRQAQAAPLDHLDVVVGKTDGAEGQRSRRP